MDDKLEREDAVLGHDKGYIYPSSLLYMVSGMFEELDFAVFADAPWLACNVSPRLIGWTRNKNPQAKPSRLSFRSPGTV